MPTKSPEKKWYSISAKADDTAEIYIYEQIGEDWFGEGVQAKNFVKELAGLKASKINLRINSPGGSVFDGQTIYNAIKRHPATVDTYIDGVAASIASVIALAGDKVIMAPNALFMIHNPWGFAQGSADDMRKYAELLDKVRDTIVTVYREKCSLPDEEIIAAMDAETWMSAEETQAAGFCDEISSASAGVSSMFNFAGLGFRNMPPEASLIHPTEPVDLPATTPSASAEVIIPPQGAKKPEMEVVVMPEATTAPKNGANDAAEIAAMCAVNNCAEKAAEFISAGLTADAVGRKILDLHAAGKLSTPAAEAAAMVDMGKDAKSYSYQRAISAAIDMREGKQVSGFEVDIHQEISKHLPQNYAAKGGILVPMRVMNTALTTGGTNTGKETVFQEYGEFIDMLRNISVLARMGARTLTDLRGPITFPKQTGGSSVYWVGENPGSGVTQGNQTFGTMVMSPKTLQATGAVSRQLLVQSTPDVEGLVRADLAAVHALAWDKAGIHGTGAANDPTGVYAASGVNAVAMGGVPAFGKFVDMETEVNKDNALVGAMGFVTTPGMAGKMRQTLESASAGARWIWDGPALEGNMAGYKAISSNQIASNLGVGTNEHGIALGNWADLLIGMWAGLELIVDPYTLADQGLVKITSFQMCDIGLRRAESFCKATGATLA